MLIAKINMNMSMYISPGVIITCFFAIFKIIINTKLCSLSLDLWLLWLL